MQQRVPDEIATMVSCTASNLTVEMQGSNPNTLFWASIVQLDLPKQREPTTEAEFTKLHDELTTYDPQSPVGNP